MGIPTLHKEAAKHLNALYCKPIQNKYMNCSVLRFLVSSAAEETKTAILDKQNVRGNMFEKVIVGNDPDG